MNASSLVCPKCVGPVELMDESVWSESVNESFECAQFECQTIECGFRFADTNPPTD